MKPLWLPVDDPQWQSVEAALQQSHQPFAMEAHHAWVQSLGNTTTQLLVLQNSDGTCAGATTLDSATSRILPGHKLLRARRFGHGLPQVAWQPAVEALKLRTKGNRTLRLNVEVFSPTHREAIGSVLQAAGFRREASPSSYRHTLVMDLTPPEAELLSTRSTVRKRLKEGEKVNAHVAVLDGRYADRIAELQRIAMQRSGGTFRIPDWPRVLAYSAAHPQSSRVNGLFLNASQTAPHDLLGFAWVCHHGDHAEYRAGGTAATTARISISFPLLWDGITWARNNGATWFDLGGVTLSEGDDALAGISDFKRNFSKQVAEVGEEWTYVPSPARQALATKLGQFAARFKKQA